MVSSLTHLYRGDSDAFSVIMTGVLAMICLHWITRSWLKSVFVLIVTLPFNLQPDFKFPVDLTAKIPGTPGWLIAAVWTLTTPNVVIAVVSVLIAQTFVLPLIKSRPSSHFIVHEVPIGEFKVLGKSVEPTMDQIPQLVAEMRESFNSGISRPIEKRVEQLKALRRFFTENESRIIAALKEDLGRPEFESVFYDNLLPLSEIDEALSHIWSWVKPKSVGFNMLTFPSKQYLQDEPLGVSLVISTWNYPIMLALTPVVGAISAGNVVVLKPCNVAKATSRLMADLLPKYMDPRILSVVGANMEGDRACTAKLLESQFDIIFFTGSPSVGKVIMEGAAKFLTPTILELGGKNPVIVDRDADIDLAAKRTVWGRMMNSGQQCIAPDYVLCQRDVIEKFSKRCAFYAKTLYGEDPKNNGNFARIVGEKQCERLAGLLKNHGGQVIHGGDYDVKERYISPTILLVDRNSPTMAEETFGPILLIVAVENVDEAIKYVNSKPKPLSLYLFSNSKCLQNKVVNNTSSGGVTINATLFHVAHSKLPFGGVGNSGMGNYHSKSSFDAFSHKKPVLIKSQWMDLGLLSDPFFLYPPWTPLKVKLMRIVAKVA